jgi:hypothetical protein
VGCSVHRLCPSNQTLSPILKVCPKYLECAPSAKCQEPGWPGRTGRTGSFLPGSASHSQASCQNIQPEMYFPNHPEYGDWSQSSPVIASLIDNTFLLGLNTVFTVFSIYKCVYGYWLPLQCCLPLTSPPPRRRLYRRGRHIVGVGFCHHCHVVGVTVVAIFIACVVAVELLGRRLCIFVVVVANMFAASQAPALRRRGRRCVIVAACDDGRRGSAQGSGRTAGRRCGRGRKPHDVGVAKSSQGGSRTLHRGRKI